MFKLNAIDHLNLILFSVLALFIIGFGLQAWQDRRTRKKVAAQESTSVQRRKRSRS